ncbi:hypothetical protein Gohar_024493 [Gossypium harknessii]|uniref:Uncharacterized protein n=1 Tax=Gossypium harknessii TaxID=34285 RepID=A0A7J9HG99_9ROSI|nr:hypothetical protein [Gossypium harknessii]
MRDRNVRWILGFNQYLGYVQLWKLNYGPSLMA